jgi:hypothetical protein
MLTYACKKCQILVVQKLIYSQEKLAKDNKTTYEQKSNGLN